MPQAFAAALNRFAVVAGCVALLAACHKTPEAPPPAPAPAAVPPKPSQPLPARAPGLWEMRVAEAGSADAAQVLQICIDALTDQKLGILGTDLSGDACQKKTFSPQGEGSWNVLAECAMGFGVVTEYSGSIVGDYTHSYAMKVRSQTTGGSLPQMNRVTNYVVDARRLGACASGQSPGDVVNEGVKMNLFDMAGIGRDGKAAASDDTPGPDVVD